jgi:hypothetical protein
MTAELWMLFVAMTQGFVLILTLQLQAALPSPCEQTLL